MRQPVARKDWVSIFLNLCAACACGIWLGASMHLHTHTRRLHLFQALAKPASACFYWARVTVRYHAACPTTPVIGLCTENSPIRGGRAPFARVHGRREDPAAEGVFEGESRCREGRSTRRSRSSTSCVKPRRRSGLPDRARWNKSADESSAAFHRDRSPCRP